MVLQSLCYDSALLIKTRRTGARISCPSISHLSTPRSILRLMKCWQNGSSTYSTFRGQVIAFVFASSIITQSASALGLNSATRFLTRTYLDCTLQQKALGEEMIVPLAVTALSLAIKFNEKSEVQSQLTPQYLFSMADLPYSGDHYYSLESQIVGALRFRFKFTTPFDYIPIFAAIFPWNASCQAAITDILNLTIVLPACASFSSEEIFYATIKTIFQAKAVLLSPMQAHILASVTDTWSRATQLSLLILDQIRSFLAA